MSRVHIVGAGLAGLSCAVRLARAGRSVTLYEAAGQAGGRCRSYHDAKLGCTIDNGNHLLLSANRAALDYLTEIGTRDSLVGPAQAAFPFVDLRNGERWVVRPNRGPLPWWVLSAARRVPHTGVGSYLAGLRLAFAGADATVADCLDPADPLWERFWEPLTVAALNTAPQEASARLLWLVVRETFAKGAAACRPLIARDGLAASLVDPALALLQAQGVTVHFNRRLRRIAFDADRAVALDFGEERVPLAPDDWLVVALPPWVAPSILPGVDAPQEARPIVNAHIRLNAPPRPAPGMSAELPILGLIGGATQWLFLRGPLVSLTVSAAEALADDPGERIATQLWQETARALDLPPEPMPPVRIVKERRATFAQTPAALRRRPPTGTAWANVALAGDWTDTGFPATIEGAVRSGHAAARLVTEKSRRRGDV
jgi:squalene-associated FAD-dependent desaturase